MEFIYGTDFNEIYALVVVCDLLNLDVTDFLNPIESERPDLQSVKLNIGIEVTSAIIKVANMNNSFTNRTNKLSEPDRTICFKNLVKKSDAPIGIFYDDDGNKCGSYLPLTTPADVNLKLIPECIDKKNKLFKEYKQFGSNLLYIASNEFLDLDVVEKIVSLDVCKNCPFNKIIINNNKIIYILSINNKSNNVEIQMYENNKLDTYKKNAISYMENL